MLKTGEKKSTNPQILSEYHTQNCETDFHPQAREQKLQNGEELVEFSGITHSLYSDDIYWGHNDRGNENYIYAVHQNGQIIAHFDLDDNSVVDTEDIASAKCPFQNKACLYIFDIGDNQSQREYSQVFIYEEPTFSEENLTQAVNEKIPAKLVYRIKLDYMNGAVNAEAGMVSGDGQQIYVIEKTDNSTSQIFSFDLSTLEKDLKRPETLFRYQTIGRLNGPGDNSLSARNKRITGAALHASGQELLIRSYYGVYRYLLEQELDLASLSTQTGILIVRPNEEQGEAVTYDRSGQNFVTVSEDPQQVNNQPLHFYTCNL